MQQQNSLYDPRYEHDACGIGFVANIKGNKDHRTVSDALTMLENMEHRGACGCEANTGDGAGIMIQIPHEFLFEECLKLGIHLPDPGEYGVAVLFLPKDQKLKTECKDALERCAETLGLELLGYRPIPVNRSGIGLTALSVEPDMEHLFIARPAEIIDSDAFERKLFVLKNYASHTIRAFTKKDPVGFYVASCSQRVMVYKGQLTSLQVRGYFPDLTNKRVLSAFGLIHSRFATNTFPSWRLAQPFRYIAHNGEINTLQGNLNWLHAGEKNFATPYFTKEELEMILPVIPGPQSDSACLDNIIELLTLCGRSLPHVMMMLIPEAWDGNETMSDDKKAFYEFHASFMEPWDGPASISFTDGRIIGATLDRNGLRPSRYTVTHDDRVIMASETGVLPIDPALVKFKGRLQPGKMFVVDMEAGRIISDEELKSNICNARPYADWLNQYKIRLEELDEPRVAFTELSDASILKYQKAFGYTSEDIEEIIKPMAEDGKEPVGSMGSDIPLAVLSERPQHLSGYFRQLFAQVTNPPIDPIRERLVMSLATFLGNNGNLLTESPMHCHTVALQHPILSSYELEKLRSIDTGIFQARTLHTYFVANGKPGMLQASLDRLCRYAEEAVLDGFEVLILCDRGVDSDHAAIPSLLATAAVHHHLIRKGLRGQVGIVVEAGDVWEVHHFACLIAFGATAINPYLALATIKGLSNRGEFKANTDVKKLEKNYIKAVCDGLLKVFSKMGISTLQSYQGAQIMEILGIRQDVVDKYFTGATSRIGGIGLDEIAQEALAKHNFAFRSKLGMPDYLPEGGIYQWKRRGEFHLFNPNTIHLLQHATRTNDYAIYRKYAKAINDLGDKACTLRSLLEFKPSRKPIPLDEVEPPENIYKRFATGAMSFGSISWEAHTTLAIAMNRLGAKSNTGEGGEDERRYIPLPNGDSMRSAIKQVASGRFGVTHYYLSEAEELQIKMAQGAKPGEGGQLPGHKVDEWIGRTRHATPGVGLISPPPHHDIYSIEDLAQLIFDLKNANRHARISVKLVSKAGVGTIAAGVAKAKADVVLISGQDGGTGASPISSIRHAGLPWELGLAETHQTLVKNGLRNRIVLQTDGQLKTGRDIAIATLLGAEEWGVATAALVVEGCIMMRKCHLNTCPVGVATQNEELRKRFSGEADHVVNFIKFLVQELREIMAELGYRTINEMVGQVQDLKVKDKAKNWKTEHLDLSRVLYKNEDVEADMLYCNQPQEHGLDHQLDWKLLEVAKEAIKTGKKAKGSFDIVNTDRAVGTILSYEVTKQYKAAGMPADSLHFKFRGTAGQSFGAFVTKGITLEIEGDANDYFGKGLSGGKLIIYPPKSASFKAEENSIIGNVALYGATSGEVYIRGKAGERFAVRNSGANVVVESVGDHGCEYMTGGTAVILGSTGRNFAAGMSGGIAFVYDPSCTFKDNVNAEMVDLDPLIERDRVLLLELIQKHYQYTESTVAGFILSDLHNQLSLFIKVYPKDYKKAIQVKNAEKINVL
jgi:glutamate synthase (NADPH/NADH) large chain